MSTPLTPVITSAGITALIDAKNRGMQAKITHVAVGDGVAGDGSGPYVATEDMTALRHEIQRVIVSGGEQIGNKQNQLHLTATIQDEGRDVPSVYPIYEIGFFLETGELFAIYASPDEKLAEKVAGTDFLLAFDLTFTGADAGDIVIDGSGTLETPAARDNILLGPNTIKIHTQAEFDSVFNQGVDTVIPANATIALSPIQGMYQPDDTGRWQVVREITAFSDSSQEPGVKVTCVSEGHGLSEGATILILQSQHYNGNYSVSNATDDSFDVLASFVSSGSAKWAATDDSAYTDITSFADSANAPGTQTTCSSAGHGLSAGTSVLITQSHYYNGVYTLVNLGTDSFDIDTPYIAGDIDNGAWGGTGDEAHNTFNGRPAYILKNSIVLSENVSIIGFNPEDTLVVKNVADTKIKIQGSSGAPVTGVHLKGWSFDGRGGVESLGGTLTGADDGGAFYLDYCEHSTLECKIINHSTSGNGGGVFGANHVKTITAHDIHLNSAVNGGGVYGCSDSTFVIYNCAASSAGNGAHSCENTILTLFGCEATQGSGIVVADNNSFRLSGKVQASSAMDENAPGILLLPLLGDSNAGGRVFFKENAVSDDGFSVGYNGNANDAILNWPADTFCISNHDADESGSIAIAIEKGSGNVSVGGISAFASDLTVFSESDNNGLTLQTSNNDFNQGIAFQNEADAYTWYIHRKDAGDYFADLVFAGGNANNSITALAERMVIDKDGHVGIGTSSPAARLSINGGLHVGGDSDPGDNNLEVDGYIVVGGTVEGRDIAADGSRLDSLYTSIGLSALTAAEVNQLENIGSTTISSAQWAYLGGLNQAMTTSSAVSFSRVSTTGGLHVGGTSNPGDNNLSVDGNITVKGTVDGRDIATDGSRLDSLYTSIGLSALTAAEVNQLENIGSTTISSTQWAHLGGLNQALTTSSAVSFSRVSTTGGLHVGGTSDPGDNNLKVDGNVGIGLDVPTTSRVAISGWNRTPALYVYNGANGYAHGLLIGSHGNRANYELFRIRSNLKEETPQEVMLVRGDGKVGIGTAEPSTALHISSGTSGDCILTIEADIDNNNENDNPRIKMLQDAGSIGVNIGFKEESFGGNKFGIGRIHNGTEYGDTFVINAMTGNIGIGTNDPIYPLQVATYVSAHVDSYGYVNGAGNTGKSSPNANRNYSIYAEQRVRASEFNATSDARVKQIKGVSDQQVDITTLLKLEVTDYCFKDKLKHGDREKKGLIAQQVEQVFPQAVQQSKDFIPDIFVLRCGSDIEYQENSSSLTVHLAKDHELHTGDKLRFIVDGQGQVDKDVIAIEDPRTFTVADWQTPVDKVFVYGKQVDNFRTIDYDQILMLCISVVQQHEQRYYQLQQEKSELQSKVDTLQKNYNDLKSELAELKGMLLRDLSPS